MAARLSLFDPTAAASAAPLLQHHILDGLQGKVVGFIDNTKPNFHYLVDDLSDLLRSRYGVKSVVKRTKGKVSSPVSQEVMDGLATECDLVITGSGD